MDKQRALYLLDRYHTDSCTTEERAEFALLLHDPRFVHLLDQITDSQWPVEGDADLEQASPRGYWQILCKIKSTPQTKYPFPKKSIASVARVLAYLVASAVIIFSGILLYRHNGQETSVDSITDNLDIQPGGNKATLELADGRIIILDEQQEGIILDERRIFYQDGSQEVVSIESKTVDELVLSTPKAGTYQLILPDGTKVWLNAQSTLRYPSRFTDDERTVYLSGEGYFQVRSVNRSGTEPVESEDYGTKRKVPFRVISNGQTVEVLGTEFNIFAYEDEAEIRTTVVEGAVQVVNSRSKANRKLIANDQAVLREAYTDVRRVDPFTAVAWKSGRFSFDGKPFQQVMNEVARWYDLDVQYDGPIPTERLVGDAFRDQNLSVLLAMLDVLEINYTLESKKRKLTIHGMKGGSSIRK